MYLHPKIDSTGINKCTNDDFKFGSKNLICYFKAQWPAGDVCYGIQPHKHSLWGVLPMFSLHLSKQGCKIIFSVTRSSVWFSRKCVPLFPIGQHKTCPPLHHRSLWTVEPMTAFCRPCFSFSADYSWKQMPLTLRELLETNWGGRKKIISGDILSNASNRALSPPAALLLFHMRGRSRQTDHFHNTFFIRSSAGVSAMSKTLTCALASKLFLPNWIYFKSFNQQEFAQTGCKGLRFWTQNQPTVFKAANTHALVCRTQPEKKHHWI